VGRDQSIAFVDIANHCLIADRELDGVFFEFIPFLHYDDLIVLHDLGAARFDFSGNLLWSATTPDIAESAKLRNKVTLVIRHQGPEKELVIDVRTGRAESHNSDIQ
jgi:hypothetical protein